MSESKIPNNEIWYTTTDSRPVYIINSDGFGANIISNTYENGKGVITFDGEIKNIANEAFSDCSSLTSITIPDSVTKIGDYAFSGCKNLTSIAIPDSVTVIGWWTFSDCKNLTKVSMRVGTVVDSTAFDGCDKLDIEWREN